jgi:endoglucanase
MSRKSTIVSLCILGTLGALGACCCCSGFFDPNNPNGHWGGGGGHGHVGRGPGFIFWGGGSHPTGPGGVGPPHAGGPRRIGSSSPRGGFGATGSGSHASGGSGGGAGAGA